MCIIDLKPGERAIITGYTKENRRAVEMGLWIGREIEFLRTAPLGDPVELKVGFGSFMIIDKDVAYTIQIKAL